MRLFRRSAALLFLPFLAACSPSASFPTETIALTGRESTRITVEAEIADEPSEHERGLMGRTVLPEGTGMLFVFGEERTLSFWMKNTLIPLDIIFFDADGAFVSGMTMTPCEEDPCPVYASSEPASMALEVPSGFIRTYLVGQGWHLLRSR